MKQLYSIQYLRAVAALLVVHCHAIDLQMKFGVSIQQNFHYLQNFGAFGVDVFFVISGFIMAYISKSESGLAESILFIKKRFIRINPTYYLISLVMLGFILLETKNPGLPTKLIVKTITILPIIDYGQHFWSPLLFIGWTLSFEWYFYLLLGILIASSVVKLRNWWLMGLLLVLVILGVIIPTNEVHWNFMTNPMLLEFGLGLLLAIVYMKVFTIKFWIPLTLLLAASFLVIYLVLFGYGDISEATLILDGGMAWKRLFFWGIPATLIVAGTLFMEQSLGLRFLKSKLLLLLGNASYAIYLIHPVCFALVTLFSKHLGFLNSINADILIFIFIFISSVTGILFHLLVEKSLIRSFNAIFLKPKLDSSAVIAKTMVNEQSHSAIK